DAVALAVLRAGPSGLWIWRTRHLPPPVLDVLAAHVGDLARALTSQQDDSQCRSQMRPERGDLAVAEHALATPGLGALDASAWVVVDDLPLDAELEDGARGGQGLVRHGGGGDISDGGADAGPRDALRV